ncbi:MAG: nitroreductase [Actinomycetia bacterium]|nr:nitroreductase [Actinomycetes bacterium]
MNLDDFAELAHARRTSMAVQKDVAVPRDVVMALCDLAQFAPNHKRTWPWRFALADGDGRARLGDVIADAIEAHGDTPEKVAKARTKYLRTPSVLVVGSAAGDTELRTAENRDAVAAGIQNILLAATAHGLASYWSSCPKGANDATAQLCGFDSDTTIVAIIYLGWATTPAAVPARPAPTLNVIE